MSQTLFLLYHPVPARPMLKTKSVGAHSICARGSLPYRKRARADMESAPTFFVGAERTRVLPCCVCRGDHWSPANLPPQRIFRDSCLVRQAGTGEQCSPLQEFSPVWARNIPARRTVLSPTACGRSPPRRGGQGQRANGVYCSFASVASASSRMRSNFSRAASTGAGVARSTPAWRSSSSG